MEDKALFGAVKAGDRFAVENLLDSGADVNATDEQGWTPLNYAAGKGDLAVARVLVDRGADPFKTSRDNRRPYLIALAAGRVEVVKFLREAEERVDPELAKSLRPPREYCKAYYLRDLKQFADWPAEANLTAVKDSKESDEETDGDEQRVVFIHQDFTVTASMRHDEEIIFNSITPEWQQFCFGTLAFRVPDDLDLIVAADEQVV
jgi:hypothetical protein